MSVFRPASKDTERVHIADAAPRVRRASVDGPSGNGGGGGATDAMQPKRTRRMSLPLDGAPTQLPGLRSPAAASVLEIHRLKQLQRLPFAEVLPPAWATAARQSEPHVQFLRLPRPLQEQYVLDMAKQQPGVAVCALDRMGVGVLTRKGSLELLRTIAHARPTPESLNADAAAMSGLWWRPQPEQVQELALLIVLERCWAAGLLDAATVVSFCGDVLDRSGAAAARDIVAQLLDQRALQDVARIKCVMRTVWQCRMHAVGVDALCAVAPLLRVLLAVPNPLVRRECVDAVFRLLPQHGAALGELAVQEAGAPDADWESAFVRVRDVLIARSDVPLRYSAPEPLVTYHGTSNKYLRPCDAAPVAAGERVLLQGGGARLVVGMGPGRAPSQLGDGFYVVSSTEHAESDAGGYGFRRAQRDNQERGRDDSTVHYDGCTVRIEIENFHRLSGYIVDDIGAWWKLHDSAALHDPLKQHVVAHDFLYAPVDNETSPHEQIKFTVDPAHVHIPAHLALHVLRPAELIRRTTADVERAAEQRRQQGWFEQGDQWD